MIEILNILFIILISLILYSNYFTRILLIKTFNNNIITSIEYFSINILIFCLICLFLSFLNIDYELIIFSTVIISALSILFNFKKFNFNSFRENNYLFTFIIFSLIIALDLIVNPKLEWDGHSWYFHALNFYENFNNSNLTNTSYSHYPHLGGFMWSVYWKFSLLPNEVFGRIFYIIIYVTGILTVSQNFSNNHLFNFIVGIFLTFLTYDKFLLGGYQEYFMFSVILIIMNMLNKFHLKNINYIQISFFITCAYLLVWIKNEGLLFFLFILYYLSLSKSINKKIYIFCLSLLLISIKFFMTLEITENNIFDLSNINFLFNENFFYKLFFILKHFIIATFKYPIWLIFFLILLICKITKKDLYIISFIIYSIFLIIFIFLFTGPSDNIEWYVTGALDRILFQLSGFIILFVVIKLRELWKPSGQKNNIN
ncbi:MAG: hypothetical protein CMI79_03205 [Candidatus Pelagibacter sp.]|nr:hypothetical protein [Candidatus Pelagibacter sp.]